MSEGSFVLEEQKVSLQKVFEHYCQYGEPMNKRLLKSSKLVRLLKECGLIQSHSQLPEQLEGKAIQITTTDIDIAFSKVCFTDKQQSPERISTT